MKRAGILPALGLAFLPVAGLGGCSSPAPSVDHDGAYYHEHPTLWAKNSGEGGAEDDRHSHQEPAKEGGLLEILEAPKGHKHARDHKAKTADRRKNPWQQWTEDEPKDEPEGP